ncbi:MAG: tetratricopeptide repeat protein [Blastochloris sp.]|nr:tetratricopeptide repeat protein [Blastochloris sp.]
MANLEPVSQDDPRIINDTEAFITKNLYPVIVGVIIILAAACAFTWWIATQKASEGKANALYATAKTTEEKQKLLQTYPQSGAAALTLIDLAQAELTTKNYAAAITHYQLFLKTFPQHPVAGLVELSLAITLENSGNKTEAQAAYAKIVSAKPEHAFVGAASIGLARLYLQENKLLAARQTLSDFIASHEDDSVTNEAREMLNTLPPAIK